MINPSTNKIAVIILNWNGSDDTILCVNSLSSQSYENFDIILIDNGSDTDSLKILDTFVAESTVPITYIKNKTNLGFAGGVNTGIRYAMEREYDAVALLNNDAVADSEWLTSLAAELHQQDVAIVTGTLLHEDGKTIDSTGEIYSIWGLPFPRSRDEPAGSLPSDGLVFGATGGSTLYRISLFKEIGLFDEHFFAYYEDIDLSFRAQLAGRRVYFTPNAIAYHKQGASSKKVPGFTVYQAFKNLPLLYLKNVPAGLIAKIRPRFYAAYALFFANAVRSGNGSYAMKGFISSVRLRSYAVTERKRIQKGAKVSSDYIASILWSDLPPNQPGLRKLRKRLTGK